MSQVIKDLVPVSKDPNELGILTLISSGCISSLIVVRSDNLGVVVALAQGTWKLEFGLQDVLERIMEMCRSFHLDLQSLEVGGPEG